MSADGKPDRKVEATFLVLLWALFGFEKCRQVKRSRVTNRTLRGWRRR